MRISVDAYMEREDDGYSGSVSLSRDDVLDAQQLAQLFAEAAHAFGFSYVKSVGFECEDGDMLWGDT
tara:strand:+ start:604 stop:804 length:201 start_codon:yes stop_codon:yes gene_type:complete